MTIVRTLAIGFVDSVQGVGPIETDPRHPVDDIEQDQFVGMIHLTAPMRA